MSSLKFFASNFNRFDGNPNTGEPFGTAVEPIIASQQIFHTAEYPSRISLPSHHRYSQDDQHPDNPVGGKPNDVC